MRSWDRPLVRGLLVAFAAGCQPATADHPEPAQASHAGGEQRERGGAAQVPPRPRFQYVPRAYSAAKVNAAGIELVFADARTDVRPAQLMVPAMALPLDGQTLEVALPLGYEALVRERLDRLVSGSGPVLTFKIEVKKLAASRSGDIRRLDIDLAITVEDQNGRPLVRGAGSGNKELLGPPYDNAELDDLHRAATLDALDAFLASEPNIDLINGDGPR